MQFLLLVPLTPHYGTVPCLINIFKLRSKLYTSMSFNSPLHTTFVTQLLFFTFITNVALCRKCILLLS